MGPPGSPKDGGLTREDVLGLYAQFAPIVFRRARVLVSCDADAWDVVQEVFERMLTHGAAFRGEARPMTWVYRITTNVALNQVRSRKLRQPLLTIVPDEPSTGADHVETRQLLSKWLGHLSERELEVATLLYVDGLTQQEVGEILGLSRKTIVREVDDLRNKLQSLGALPEAVSS